MCILCYLLLALSIQSVVMAENSFDSENQGFVKYLKRKKEEWHFPCHLRISFVSYKQQESEFLKLRNVLL